MECYMVKTRKHIACYSLVPTLVLKKTELNEKKKKDTCTWSKENQLTFMKLGGCTLHGREVVPL